MFGCCGTPLYMPSPMTTAALTPCWSDAGWTWCTQQPPSWRRTTWSNMTRDLATFRYTQFVILTHFMHNQFWGRASLKYPTQHNGFQQAFWTHQLTFKWQQQMWFKWCLICSVVGDRPRPHCQSFLHHPRVHNDLQPAAEAYTEWDRALQGVLALIWVQKHHRQRGMCLI